MNVKALTALLVAAVLIPAAAVSAAVIAGADTQHNEERTIPCAADTETIESITYNDDGVVSLRINDSERAYDTAVIQEVVDSGYFNQDSAVIRNNTVELTMQLNAEQSYDVLLTVDGQRYFGTRLCTDRYTR